MNTKDDLLDLSRRCSLSRLGELLSNIESFNESKTFIKGDKDLFESFLLPRKSNTESLHKFKMIQDEELESQLANMEKDLVLKEEAKNNGILNIIDKNKINTNNQKTDKKLQKQKKDKSQGISSTTKSQNTANFSGTSKIFFLF